MRWGSPWWVLAACFGRAPSHPPPSSPPDGPRVRLEGELVGIRLQNVNKAQGHWTYHVDLLVRPRSGAPAPGPLRAEGPDGEPAPLPVRLPQRLSWAALSEPERAALSPSGPAHTLSPASWAGWTVGEPVALTVVFTGPDLAHAADESGGG